MTADSRLLLVLVVFLSVFVTIGASTEASESSSELFKLCMELYKWDEYLPGVDLLERSGEGMENSFNYWLYLGLGYQRTGQNAKAINAYEKASVLNPAAGNLVSRIRTLKIETKRLGDVKSNIDSDRAKAEYLMAQSLRLRKESNLDRAFRTFLQALTYNPELLNKDEGFITQAEVFYGLKKVEYSEFFQGSFQLLQGDLKNAEMNLSYFLKSPGKKPAIFVSRAEESIEKIRALKKVIVSESVGFPDVTNKLVANRTKPVEKHAVNNQVNVEAIEQQITAGGRGRFKKTDSGFVEFFAAEVAGKIIAELSQTVESERQCRLIWELGNSNLQTPDVMSALIAQLEATEIEVLNAAMEAIGKIGAPSATSAIDRLISLIEHDDPLIKFLAIETLGKIKEQPEKVIPILAKDYAAENDIYLKRHLYYWVNKFGKPGIQVLYRELEETARVDRKPLAELINRITGERIQTLIDR